VVAFYALFIGNLKVAKEVRLSEDRGDKQKDP